MKGRKLYAEVMRRKDSGDTSTTIAKDLGLPLSHVSHLVTLRSSLCPVARQAFDRGDLTVSAALVIAGHPMIEQPAYLPCVMRLRKRSLAEIREYYHRLAFVPQPDRDQRWHAIRSTLGWVIGVTSDEPFEGP